MTSTATSSPASIPAKTQDDFLLDYEPPGQWRLESLQVVNWGSFHNHTLIAADQLDTMLIGASGSGKSTLADAYSNLLNPSAPFNEASNATTRGRARSADRRNEASYLRGQLGTDETGGPGRYLRGPETWTWGGQAATFTDGTSHVTLIRLFFIPAKKTRTSDVRGTYAIADRPVHLLDFQPHFAASGISSAIRRAFPDIDFFSKQADYCAAMDSRLSLGTARPLLARIQAGKTFNDVDSLFKDTVLETPSTYAKADTGLAGFTHMSGLHDDILNTARQAKTLEGLDTDADAYHQAVTDHETLTVLGDPKDPAGPVALWLADTHFDLLDKWEPQCLADLRAAEARHQQAEEKAQQASDEHLRLYARAQQEGATAVTELKDKIDRHRTEVTTRTSNRERLGPTLAPFGPIPDTAPEYDDLTAAAQQHLNTAEPQRAPLKAALDTANQRVWELAKDQRDLTERIDLLLRRGDLIPPRMDAARNAMARAAGLTPEQLPFVAELFDLHPDEDRWRPAVELTLSGLARNVVVDEDRLREFSAAIDALDDPAFARLRVHFRGVPTDLDPAEPTSSNHISGKITYAPDSPFTGWLSRHLAENDHLCVTDPADLDGPGPRVTIKGQTRHNQRGAHGGFAADPIIGFSNTRLIDELTARRTALDAQADQAARDKDTAQRALDEFDARTRAARELLRWNFTDFDTATPQTEITRLEELHAQLTSADSPLAHLLAEVDRARDKADQAAEDKTNAKNAHLDAQARYEGVVDDKDAADQRRDRLHAAGVTVEPEHAELLETLFTVTDTTEPEEWDRVLVRGMERFTARINEAGRNVKLLRTKMEQMFARYDDQWPDRERTTDITSLPDYLKIHDNLRNSGLSERIDEFSRLMNDWAGQDLLPLYNAIDTEIAAISQRLEPINDILRRFPFGDQNHYLQLVSNRLHDDEFANWRARMKDVISGGTTQMDWKAVQTRYRKILDVVDPLRHPRDGGSDAQRDRYLDINRRVRITAEEYAPDGTRIGTIGNLAHFSGGESQELSAVIQVAALRYALGDSARPKPRFGVIVMDEAFIKADKAFTQRSLTTLQNLGFQTVVAGPQQSMNAVQDFVEKFAFVSKRPNDRTSFVTMAEAARTGPGAAGSAPDAAGSAPDAEIGATAKGSP